MQRMLKSITSGMFSLACTGAILAGLCTSDVQAQDEKAKLFEVTHGGHCAELGRNGVQAVMEGGYISVGETRSVVDDCSRSDVYVVRSYDNGRLFWSRSYDLGGNDNGLSIREVLNDPEGRGGFIITGQTDAKHSECGLNRDLFLLRIDRCGNVIWSQTYGTPDYAEVGWDVVEASTEGNPDYGTSVGDFIAAGYTTRSKSGSGRDGYIVRASWADGSRIWDATYDGPGQRDDYFRAVDEAIYNNETSTGDIIVAGASSSYPQVGFQGWLLRVSGDNGTFSNGIHGSAAYGKDGFEEFRSVQELRYSAYAGEIVAAGTTTSLVNRRDVYVVQTTGHPCEFRNDAVFGDFGALADEANWAREITFDVPGAPEGALIVTGHMTAPAGKGHGKADVFLQILKLGSLDNFLGPVLYGGDGVDWGHSVIPTSSPILEERNPDCVFPGFVVAGHTNSSGYVEPGDPNQLYLIGTDEFLENECTAHHYDVQLEHPNFDRDCHQPSIDLIEKYCTVGTESQCQYWEHIICINHEEHCEIDDCECQNGFKQNTGGSAETGTGVLSLSSYPNPVKSGSIITLQYMLNGDTRMSVTVSDLMGRTMYSSDVNAKAGNGTHGVSTEGWTSGTYMVNVAVNGRTSSTRVIVTE